MPPSEPPRSNHSEGRIRGRDFDSQDDTERDDDPPIRRFPRLLAPPVSRRLSRNGIAIAAGLWLSLVLLILIVVNYQAIPWLHRQPVYSLQFADIQLVPPPPSWFRGGTPAFLARLSDESNHERFSALNVDLAALADKFRNDPLVKRVEMVSRSTPNQIKVVLVYRQPVAIPFFEKRLRDPFAIDEEGALIAKTDFEIESWDPPRLVGETTPLLWLHGLDKPFKPQSGKSWMKNPGLDGVSNGTEGPDVDPRAAEAGRVAAFLRGKLAQEKALPTLLKHLVLQVSPRGVIFLQCGNHDDSPMVRWQTPRNLIGPGNYDDKLDDSEKWAQLLGWAAKLTTSTPESPRNLAFSAKGLIPIPDPKSSTAVPSNNSNP